MNKLRPYERKVYYYETDKMGIVHHSNYIRIFEEARMHYLTEAGIPFEKIEEEGILMPCLGLESRYKQPLVFDEPFMVYLKMEKFNGVTLKISYRVVSKRSGELCAEGSSTHCFTDMDMKPLRTKHSHPELYATISQYLNYEYDF